MVCMKYGVKVKSGSSHRMERIVREFDNFEEADSFARKMNHYEQYKDRGPLDEYMVVDTISGDLVSDPRKTNKSVSRPEKEIKVIANVDAWGVGGEELEGRVIRRKTKDTPEGMKNPLVFTVKAKDKEEAAFKVRKYAEKMEPKPYLGRLEFPDVTEPTKIGDVELKEMIRAAIREQAPPSADVAKLGDKLGKASGVGSMQSKINTPQEAAAAIVDALKGYTLKPGEDIVALTKAINMIKGQKKAAPQPGQPGLATEARDKKKLDPVGKEDPDVDNDGDVDDSDSYLRNRRKVIGKEVKKEQKGNWIKGAIEKPGALRKTAKEKGLLKGDEKLSKTDLDKLEKMGGKTAKRARLAKTLKGLGEAAERMPGLKRFTVMLKNIDWDTDLKDGSEPETAEELGLPEELTIRVDAFNKGEALDAALDRVSDDYGFLINGTEPEFRVEPEEPEFMDITKIVREMAKEEIAKHKSKRSK